MKLDEKIKCPHCGEESWYVFYDGTEMIECHICDRPFDIKLKTKIEVIATIPERQCCICENKFIANNTFEDEVICPNCGYKGGHYKILKS